MPAVLAPCSGIGGESIQGLAELLSALVEPGWRDPDPVVAVQDVIREREYAIRDVIRERATPVRDVIGCGLVAARSRVGRRGRLLGCSLPSETRRELVEIAACSLSPDVARDGALRLRR